MANRRSTPPPAQAPVLSPDQLRRRIAQLRRCIDALEAFDPQKVQKRYGEPEVMRLEAMIDEALAASFGHGTPGYRRYRDAAKLDHGPHVMRLGPAFGRGRQIDYDAQDAYEARQYLTEGKAQAIALLRQAISALEDQIADQEPGGYDAASQGRRPNPAVSTDAPLPEAALAEIRTTLAEIKAQLPAKRDLERREGRN